MPAPAFVQGTGDLQYHNGSVQHQPSSYLVFWGTGWTDSLGYLNLDGAIPYDYLNDLSSTSFENILTQYYDNSGPITITHTISGVLVDATDPLGGIDKACSDYVPTLEDTNIQNEASWAASHMGWTVTSDAVIYVFTSNNYYVRSGNLSCSDQNSGGMCAYHGWSSAYNWAYAALPYPFSSGCQVGVTPNNDTYGDSLASLVSHEQFEAITDPYVSGGWYDSTTPTPDEIGDKCAWDFSEGYTYLNNGGIFIIQTEYSNKTHSCVNWYGNPRHNDVNGDGKSDALAFYDKGSDTTGIYEWQTNGNNGNGATLLNYLGSVWSSSGFAASNAKWITGDFNGDGYTDVMAFYNLGSPAPYNVPAIGAYEWINNKANGFTYEGRIWSTLGNGGFNWNAATFAAGDLNHDGKTDAVAFYNKGTDATGIYEWLTTGSGTTLSYLGSVWLSTAFDWTKAKWVTGDFNNDGYADVMAFYNLGSPAPYNVPAIGTYVWLNNHSNGFTSEGQIWNTLGNGTFNWSSATFAAGDLNRDGKSDALAFYDKGSGATGIYEWLTTGSGTTLNYLGSVWSSTAFTASNAKWVIGDFNSDGYADVMAFYNLGSPAPYNVPAIGAYEWLNTGSNGLISEGQIWNTLGNGGYNWNASTWAA